MPKKEEEKAVKAAAKPKAEKAVKAAAKPKAEKAVKAAAKPKAEKAVKAAAKPKAEKAVKAAAKPKAEKEASPEKAIPVQGFPDMVILPQSQSRVFLIWRAQPELDAETDSWVIRTSLGEVARVPASSRSVFLEGSGVFHIDIFRRLADGRELLFLSKSTKGEDYPSSSQPAPQDSAPRLNSSSQSFRRRISS